MAEARPPNPLVEQFRRGGVARELRLIAAAGVDLLEASRASADLLGVRLGAVGSPACLLGVRALDAESLAAPVWVMNDGKMLA